MTIQFSDYLASRPVSAAPIGATDKTMILQDGAVKIIDPKFTAVLTVSGVEGLRCQVSASYGGPADDGTPIINLNVTPV